MVLLNLAPLGWFYYLFFVHRAFTNHEGLLLAAPLLLPAICNVGFLALCRRNGQLPRRKMALFLGALSVALAKIALFWIIGFFAQPKTWLASESVALFVWLLVSFLTDGLFFALLRDNRYPFGLAVYVLTTGVFGVIFLIPVILGLLLGGFTVDSWGSFIVSTGFAALVMLVTTALAGSLVKIIRRPAMPVKKNSRQSR